MQEEVRKEIEIRAEVIIIFSRAESWRKRK